MRKILTLSRPGPIVLAVAAAAALVGGCRADGGEPVTERDTVSIVVTTSILGDVVGSSLEGLDRYTVETVMPTGADPHDFQPSARQAEAMQDADLLVVNGLDLEQGLLDVVAAVRDSGTPVFAFTDHVTVIGDAGTHRHDGEDSDHTGDDPHFWMDPTRMVDALEVLETELLAADPAADADAVRGAFSSYIGELGEVDTEIEEILGAVPDTSRSLVTSHESFGYFADRYGFEIVGAVIPSTTTGSETSASELEALADLMIEHDVRAVFTETTESDRLARALADEVGSGVDVVELFTGSLGEPGSGAETYLGLLRTDAERISGALGGT